MADSGNGGFPHPDRSVSHMVAARLLCQPQRQAKRLARRGHDMKRRLLIFSVLVVFGALAFGANAAFASLDFNPQTGEMSYSTEGINVDKGDVVTVRHAESVGFTNWIKVEYKDWQFGQVYATANMAKYCFHEDYVLWACPAKKVSVRTGKGGDQITVSYDVKTPTVLEGGPGSDIIY